MSNKKPYQEDLEILEEFLPVFLASKSLQQPEIKTKDLTGVHENKNTLTEIAFYPAHDPRKETKGYRAAHKKLIKTLDMPCIICGVRNSTLKDPTKNLYGAKALETHHSKIEHALMNAIDPVKFNTLLRPRLLIKNPERKLYQRGMTIQEMKDWIDHDEDNLWVLCDQHHRSKFIGIHRISYPIWAPANLLIDEFENYVREQLQQKSKEDKSNG